MQRSFQIGETRASFQWTEFGKFTIRNEKHLDEGLFASGEVAEQGIFSTPASLARTAVFGPRVVATVLGLFEFVEERIQGPVHRAGPSEMKPAPLSATLPTVGAGGGVASVMRAESYRAWER